MINFSVKDWSDINKLKELQAEANRHSITKLKDFIHENNVSVVGILTIILSVTVVANLLFLFYYLNCYSKIYSLFMSFYQRTQKSKNRFKSNDKAVFRNVTEPGVSQILVIPSTNLEAIEPVLEERLETIGSRNLPSPTIRPKHIPLDATSNRITMDF